MDAQYFPFYYGIIFLTKLFLDELENNEIRKLL